MNVLRVLMMVIVAISLAACGNGNNEGMNSGASSNAPSSIATQGEGEAMTASASQEQRTIEHAMGTTVLEKKPERVVVLYNGMVDNMVALGVKPVGAVESWDEKPWYNFLRDSMEGVENLGEETQPNLEAIIALNPDLIIGTKSRHEKIYPQLKDIAPTIITEELFDWKTNLTVGAKALYMDDKANEILSNWETRVADFKQKVGSSLEGTEVSLLRFEKDGSSRIYITGFAGTIFQELGLSRPKAQQAIDQTVVNLTSKEQMAQLDGDYIFDLTQIKEDEPSREQAQTDWTNHPLWKNLKGVKNDKYFKVDVVTWNLSAGALAAQSLLDDLYDYFEIK